jgi:parallel beta-helix repeat protein
MMRYSLLIALLLWCATAQAATVLSVAPNDDTDDTQAIQDAISALPEGGTLLIPQGTFTASMFKGIYVDTARVKLVFEGDLHVITEGRESYECTNLFTVRAPGVQFIGQGGMIYGDGEPFLGTKGQRDMHRTVFYPKFVYATQPADDCVIRDMHMRDTPGGFLGFVGVSDCAITGSRFEGGATEGLVFPEGTPHAVSRYLGVTIIGTKGMMIQGNHFSQYENRAMYSWITASGSNRHDSTVIDGNVFEGGYDHAIYTSGLRNSVVTNNTCRNSVSVAIKLIGENLVVVGNQVFNSTYGGISTRNGSRCIIAHNIINGFGHRGISVTPYGGGNKSPYTDCIIQGNIVIGDIRDEPGSRPVMSGIHVLSQDHVSRIKVIDNIIHNTGTGNSALSDALPGEPAIYIGGPNMGSAIHVGGNTIHNAQADGIELHNVSDVLVTDNIVQCAGDAVVQDGCENVIQRDNIIQD